MENLKILRAVGLAFKGAHPEQVADMRHDGYATDLVSLGRYIQENDPETFEREVEYLQQGGPLTSSRANPAGLFGAFRSFMGKDATEPVAERVAEVTPVAVPMGVVEQVVTLRMRSDVFLKLSYCSDPKTTDQPPACVLRRGCRPATPIAPQQLWLQPCEQGKWQVMGAVGRPAALRNNIQGRGAAELLVVCEFIDGVATDAQLEKLSNGAFSQDGQWVPGPLFVEVL